MKKAYVICLLAIVCLLSLQCKKEYSNDGFGFTDFSSSSRGVVQGTILDEMGEKATGVSVRIGASITQTDKNGFFRLEDAPLGKEFTVLKAEKAGYFTGIRSFKTSRGTNKVVIQLIKKTELGTIRNEGGELSLSNGSTISLSSNSVMKANGEAYTGNIKVYANYIDPSSPEIMDQVPASFMAVDSKGQRVTLASYGMMAVELESSAGELLQIKKGSTAQLKIKIPNDRVQSAPSTIKLWSVNEESGLWVEEAVASKQGNFYVGAVNHFSFWNADFPMPGINLEFKLVSKAGNALPGVPVVVRMVNGVGQAGGYTDSAGSINGLVPKNEKLWIVWYNQCYKAVDSLQVGPFAADTDLGTISSNKTSGSELTITGKLLDCDNKPVQDGKAIINLDGYKYHVGTDANGVYRLTILTCNLSATSFELIGIDNIAKKQSRAITQNIVMPVTNVSNLSTCGNSALEFISYTFENKSYTITDSLMAYTVTTGRAPLPIQTSISGGIDINEYIYFYFDHNEGNGKYPINSVLVNGAYSSKLNRPFDVEITNYPFSFGQFWEGKFSGSFLDSLGQNTKSISVSFRVRK